MKDRIVLITKDATCKSYIPVYEKSKRCAYRMPNLEELASKGTVFNNFYTAAPSTAMSFIAMSTQQYPYQTRHKNYAKVTEQEKDTIFDKFFSLGYECHIIWEEKWVSMAKDYSQCYGENSVFHLIHINQVVGAHNKSMAKINRDDELSKKTLNTINAEIDDVCDNCEGKLFLWIHLPHVLLGRNCYGADGDMFDKIIGHLRDRFSDDSIYVSTDHGNMNGCKGKVCYGFDVYQSAINIPLITPRIANMEKCDVNISNIHLYDIICGVVPDDSFIYSDTAYYAQPHRKLAIIHRNYKYIYNKMNNSEELYDLEFDPTEECNLINKKILDVDRHVMTPLDQVYYYPDWEIVEQEKAILREEFKRIWRSETIFQSIVGKLKIFLKRFPTLYSSLFDIRHFKSFN